MINTESPVDILKSVGIIVVETQTKPTRPGKKPRPVWEIQGATQPYIDLMYKNEMPVKRWRGTLCCWEDPTQKLAEIVKAGGLSFAEQKEREQERADERAGRLTERAQNHAADNPDYAAALLDRAAGNQRKATGQHSLEYLGNRLEDAQKELRLLNVKINGGSLGGRSNFWQPATGDRLRRLEIEKQQCEEKIAYWQSEIDAKGGVKYSKENVEVGDWVFYLNSWRRVYRVNPKSVSLHLTSHEQTCSDTAEYFDLKAYVPKDKAEAYAKEFELDLSKCHKTKLNLNLALENA